MSIRVAEKQDNARVGQRYWGAGEVDGEVDGGEEENP